MTGTENFTVKFVGDVTRIHNYFDTKGKLMQKPVTTRDNFEVRMPSGDSIVGTVDEFKKLGIEFPTTTKEDSGNNKNPVTPTTNTPQVI